jgi:hypothetical protein
MEALVEFPALAFSRSAGRISYLLRARLLIVLHFLLGYPTVSVLLLSNGLHLATLRRHRAANEQQKAKGAIRWKM